MRPDPVRLRPPHRRVSLSRAVAVTAGLMVIGAVLGTLTGTVLLAAMSAGQLRKQSVAGWLLGSAGFAALIGAPLGAIAAPLLALAGMRRVPIGRMLWMSTLGAVLGTLCGYMVAVATRTLHLFVLWSVAGGVVGLLVTVWVLRRTAPPPGAPQG